MGNKKCKSCAHFEQSCSDGYGICYGVPVGRGKVADTWTSTKACNYHQTKAEREAADKRALNYSWQEKER